MALHQCRTYGARSQRPMEPKMKGRNRGLLLMVAVLMTVGCKMHIVPELYLTDLRDVAVNKTRNVTVPATLSVEIPSSSECQKYTRQVTQKIGAHFLGFTTKGCQDQGMDSYLLANVSLPLTHSVEEWNRVKHSSLFGIVSFADEDRNRVGVHIMLDLVVYESLSDDVDIEKSAFGFIVMNDGRKADEFQVSGSFVNGVPVPYTEEYSVERRGRLDVTISDVKLSYLAKSGTIMLMALPGIE